MTCLTAPEFFSSGRMLKNKNCEPNRIVIPAQAGIHPGNALERANHMDPGLRRGDENGRVKPGIVFFSSLPELFPVDLTRSP